MVDPYFTRRRGGYSQTNTQESFSKLETLTDTPSKGSRSDSKGQLAKGQEAEAEMSSAYQSALSKAQEASQANASFHATIVYSPPEQNSEIKVQDKNTIFAITQSQDDILSGQQWSDSNVITLAASAAPYSSLFPFVPLIPVAQINRLKRVPSAGSKVSGVEMQIIWDPGIGSFNSDGMDPVADITMNGSGTMLLSSGTEKVLLVWDQGGSGEEGTGEAIVGSTAVNVLALFLARAVVDERLLPAFLTKQMTMVTRVQEKKAAMQMVALQYLVRVWDPGIIQTFRISISGPVLEELVINHMGSRIKSIPSLTLGQGQIKGRVLIQPHFQSSHVVSYQSRVLSEAVKIVSELLQSPCEQQPSHLSPFSNCLVSRLVLSSNRTESTDSSSSQWPNLLAG